MPTLTSISPLSGPPGAVVTLTGAGFDAGSQAACPTLQPTTFLSSTQLSVVVPADLAGPGGGTMPIGVYVVGADGSTSSVILFTVQFPATTLQAWTSIERVTAEVPGFDRGGRISDDDIQGWISSIAQTIAGVMLRRGLPLDPAQWQQPTANAFPTPTGVLEMINRKGAAAALAAAVASLSGTLDWPLRKNLQLQYHDEKAALESGGYDKLFLLSAATMEAGPQLAAGDTTNSQGESSQFFRKEQVF